MPNAAQKPCAGGCGLLVAKGRCQGCSTTQNRQRGSGASRGYDARWRAYRARWLAAHPFCGERHDGSLSGEHSACVRGGLYIDAQRSGRPMHVDHIVPVNGGQDDPWFWERSNHQTLCASCHAAKSRKEQLLGL